MKDIEFRYVKSGNAYLPQFKQPKFGDEWLHFTRKTFSERSILNKVAVGLAELNSSTKSRRVSKFTDEQTAVKLFFEDNGYMFFMEEILVMAFLGAAKAFYTQHTVDFEL